MSKYRKIDVRIWNDANFRDLSHNAKLVFFLLLTHPNMTALGAMRSTLSGLSEELDMDSKAFREAFREAFLKGMVKHDAKACLIALPNFIKYNQPESPNVVKAWASSLDLLPECDLKNQVITLSANALKGYSKAFQEALPEAFRKTYPKSMPNQEQEQEQEQEQLNKKESVCEEKSEGNLFVAPSRRVFSITQDWKPEPVSWVQTLKVSQHLVKPEQFTDYTLAEFIRVNIAKDEKTENDWQRFYVNALARGYIKPMADNTPTDKQKQSKHQQPQYDDYIQPPLYVPKPKVENPATPEQVKAIFDEMHRKMAEGK